MILKELQLKNFTVFKNYAFRFSPGMNIITGESGTGKTHLLKVLYSACMSAHEKVSYPQKLVRAMSAGSYEIPRLLYWTPKDSDSIIRVAAGPTDPGPDHHLAAHIRRVSRQWYADVFGEEEWKQSLTGTNSVYIPTGSVLSHAYNLSAACSSGSVRFDDTYLDVLSAAKADVSDGKSSASKEALLKALQNLIGGTVVYDTKRDGFFLQQGKSKQEISLIAEGAQKLGLLYRLIENGALEEGSILFWDEPEANISPNWIPTLVETLLLLQRSGVQIILTTHSYLLATNIEVQKTDQDKVLFHSLYRPEGSDKPLYATSPTFDGLEGNVITSSFNKLLDKIYYVT